MNKSKFLKLAAVVCLASSATPLFARQSAPGIPVSIVVTLEPKHGKAVPPVEPQDITVAEGKDKRPITSLTPLQLGQGSLQLMLLIDDSARGTFDTEINTLKQFVNALPANTEVAVAYMRNGTAAYTSNFTRDHAAAASSIRVSFGSGGADVSPYDSLSEVAKRWPQPGAQRKAVIMISSGIEGLGGGFTSDNPYVNAGIESAQKAGITVYTIYSPSVGHEGHSFWRANWGQNFLSQLSDETGGEMYAIGFGSPVSFEPYLKQILLQMQHQYLLTFEARPEQKAGLQQIKVKVLEKDASIAAPDKVFVPAGM
jgi:VWFA-related protein